MFKTLGTAFGLSFFLLLFFQSSLCAEPKELHTHELILPSNTLPQVFSALIQIQANAEGQYEIRTQNTQNQPADLLVPLHRINEVLISLALLEQIQQGKAQLEDPVNFHLQGQRLLEPFGEISLRHLLTRTHGLPYRRSGLFVTQAKKALNLKQLLELDLRPPVLPADTALIDQSMGELLQAAVLEKLTEQALEDFLPQYVKDKYGVSLQVIEQNKLAQAYSDEGEPLPRLLPATPSIHNYGLTLTEIGKLIRALHRQNRGSEWRLALLSGYQFQSEIHYLDSNWLGWQQRLAFVPGQDMAYYFVVNQDLRSLGLKLQETLFSSTRSSPPTQSQPKPSIAGQYHLMGRDLHSYRKALDLFEPAELSTSNQLTLKYRNHSRQFSEASGPWLSKEGERLIVSDTSPIRVREISGEQRSWQQSPFFRLRWVQALIVLCFFIVFVFNLLTALKFLYLYEPELNLDYDMASGMEEDQELDLSAQQAQIADSPKAGWGLHLLRSIGSLAAVTFLVGIGPAMTSWGRFGSHYAWAVRDVLPGALIFCLLMPLVGLACTLILLALSLVEWKDRPWLVGEKKQLLLYVSTYVLWLFWLAQWNLLGFKF